MQGWHYKPKTFPIEDPDQKKKKKEKEKKVELVPSTGS